MKPSKILLLLSALVLIASCKSGSLPVASEKTTAELYAETILVNRQTLPAVTAKVKLKILGSSDLSANGTLQMKRDTVVRLSVSFPFLGELGFLEFTPDSVLFVDKMNKHYAQGAYADVDFLREAGIDFYALQALFWNELFVPGSRTVAAEEIHRFSVATAGDHTLLSLTDMPKLEYSFLTQTSSGLIDRLMVEPKTSGRNKQFVCKYDKFQSLDGKSFPTFVQMEYQEGQNTSGFSLSLSRLSNESDWKTYATVPEKCSRIEVQVLFDHLLDF